MGHFLGFDLTGGGTGDTGRSAQNQRLVSFHADCDLVELQAVTVAIHTF